jgi:hypothetical protein
MSTSSRSNSITKDNIAQPHQQNSNNNQNQQRKDSLSNHPNNRSVNNRDLICEPSPNTNTASSNTKSNGGGRINGGKTVILRKTDFVSTGTSPEHDFYDDVPLTKLKPKTKIVYDTGPREMCTQGK